MNGRGNFVLFHHFIFAKFNVFFLFLKEKMKRLSKDKIEKSVLESPIVLISGPKFVGARELIVEILDNKKLNGHSVAISLKEKDCKFEDFLPLIKAEASHYLLVEEAQFLNNLQEIVDKWLTKKVPTKLILLSSYRLLMEDELMTAITNSELQHFIFAPTFYELASNFGLPNEQKELENRLIYGVYPTVIQAENKPAELNNLLDEIIHRRFGAIDRANDGEKLVRVLQLIAFHIGTPISYNEIAVRSCLDNETVERYINLLCDAFILINLPSFHTDKRYELKKSNLFYFYDNGIRNALIQNFNPSILRNDHLQLWKNYVISERIKWVKMNGVKKEFYFWKTHTQQVIDLVEIGENHTVGYKIDWEKRKKIKFPQLFQNYYPDFSLKTLNKTTYLTILTNKK